MAGRIIGPACLPCTMQPIALACVGPWLALERKDALEVSCFGSGRIRDDLVAAYGSPFAIESAHLKLRDSDVVARVIRSLFDTARQYRESLDVYGSKQSFEWQAVDGERANSPHG